MVRKLLISQKTSVAEVTRIDLFCTGRNVIKKLFAICELFITSIVVPEKYFSKLLILFVLFINTFIKFKAFTRPETKDDDSASLNSGVLLEAFIKSRIEDK